MIRKANSKKKHKLGDGSQLMVPQRTTGLEKPSGMSSLPAKLGLKTYKNRQEQMDSFTHFKKKKAKHSKKHKLNVVSKPNSAIRVNPQSTFRGNLLQGSGAIPGLQIKKKIKSKHSTKHKKGVMCKGC